MFSIFWWFKIWKAQVHPDDSFLHIFCSPSLRVSVEQQWSCFARAQGRLLSHVILFLERVELFIWVELFFQENVWLSFWRIQLCVNNVEHIHIQQLHGSNLPAPGEGKPGIDGRKMMMHREAPRSDGDEKKQVQNGGTHSGISSGATPTERKCIFQGQRVWVSSNVHHYCKHYPGESSFVAATSDYRGPKFHPPKHNWNANVQLLGWCFPSGNL